GYHLVPQADPDMRRDDPPHPLSKKTLPPPTVIFPEETWLKDIRKTMSSNFHRFAADRLGVTKEHLAKWGVGSRWKFTAFVLSNLKGETVNAKFVAYTTEGKRDKSEKEDGSPVFVPHYVGKSYLKAQKIETDPAKLEDWQDYYKFLRCFYGEHLWDKAKDTCLVESEKTAVIAAFFFPQYNWLATGGNHGMTFEQFEIFYGYTGRIWNIVDNDKAGFQKSKTIQWLDKLAEMRDDPSEILSVNLFAESKEGWDLADAIIYDNYRDPHRLYRDLRSAVDCRVEFEIDLESGEVKEKAFPKAPEVSEKELKRAKQVADRIFAGKINLLIRS